MLKVESSSSSGRLVPSTSNDVLRDPNVPETPRELKFDNIGTPRLRRLCGPVHVNHSSSIDESPRSFKSVRHAEMEIVKRNNSLVSRFEATGSLLPQPSLPPMPSPRVAKSEAEPSFTFSQIRQIHCIILQSAVDTEFQAAIERVIVAASSLTTCSNAKVLFLDRDSSKTSEQVLQKKLRLMIKGPVDKMYPCEGLAGICAEQNIPIICNRPHHDSRFNSEIDSANGSSTKTLACSPMTNLAGKVVGVIQVYNKKIGGFSEEDIYLLDLLGKQAALTFELCLRNELRESKARKTETMLKGFIKLASAASAKDLAYQCGLLAREVTGAQQANCFLLTDESDAISLTAWSKVADSKADILDERQVPLKGFMAEIFRELRSGCTAGSGGADPRACRNHLGSLYCPILGGQARSAPLGILQARGRRGGAAFERADERLVGLLCAFAAQLHEGISRNRAVASDPERRWGSTEELLASAVQTLKAAVNVHTVQMLFHEPLAESFWTIENPHLPKDRQALVRLPASTFPLSLIAAQRGAVHFPPHPGCSYSDREVAELRALARRFLGDDLPLECLLGLPLVYQGECVCVLLLINKHNASGPFERRTCQVAQALAARWGGRAHATLAAAAAEAFRRHHEATVAALPGLAACETVPSLLQRLGSFLQEHLSAERCWVVLAERRAGGAQVVALAPGAGGAGARVAGPGELQRRDPAGCWPLEEAVRGGRLALVRDARHERQRAECWLWREEEADCRSLICCPFFDETPADAGGGGGGGGGDADSGGAGRGSEGGGGGVAGLRYPGPLSRMLERGSAVLPDGRRLVGAMLAVNKAGAVDRFSERDAALLRALAPAVASLVAAARRAEEVVRLQERMRASFSRLRVVLGGVAAVHHAPGSHGLLSRVRAAARRLFRASQCNLFLAGHGRAVMCEVHDDPNAHAKFEPAAGMVGHALATGEVVHHDAGGGAPSPLYRDEVDRRGGVARVHSAVCAPLRDGEGRPVGAIQLLNCTRAGGGGGGGGGGSGSGGGGGGGGGGHGGGGGGGGGDGGGGDGSAAFTAEDGELLLEFGSHAAAALLNGGAVNKLRHCNERLIQLPLVQGLPAQAAFVSAALERILTAERANIFVRRGPRYVCDECFSGARLSVAVGEGYVGRCAAGGGAGSPVHVGDTTKDKGFLPDVDGREGINVLRCLYVPVADEDGGCALVIELLNKQSGAFDASDSEVARAFGAHLRGCAATDASARRHELARRRSLLLLTSFTYLFPIEPDAEKMVGGVLQQCSSLLQCSARLFLAAYGSDGVVGAGWTCFAAGGRRSVVPVAGTPGEAFLKAEPRVVDPVCVDDGGGAAGAGAGGGADIDDDADVPGGGGGGGGGAGAGRRTVEGTGGGSGAGRGEAVEAARYTTAYLCQPLMDPTLRRPVGVLELRRAAAAADGGAGPTPFSFEDQEFVFSFAALIVSSLLHHDRLLARQK